MIIVTGGAGLIGSALVWTLNQQGRDDIVIVDHLGESEKWQNLRALRFQDYLEKDEFRQLLLSGRWQRPPEAIVHLGACSDTTEVNASYLADNNFAYGKLLAEYAVAKGSRMVYASSAATYGDGERGFKDDEAGMFALRPLNKYGYSKLLFDQWLYQRGWLGKFTGNGASFVGLKYSNVFGPNEYHKAHMRSMILRAYEQISATGRVGLFKSYRPDYADGEQVRDFLYVKDAALMTLFFLQDGRDTCGIFNIGFGATRSWNDLARAVFAAMALPADIHYIDMPESLRARYQYYTCLEIDKIRQAGYKRPMMSLEDAVADYVAYLRDGRHLGD
ncbi:MAG: ADP-glyceromanno-heptose 6-epimerase [Lentisphaeria bacterium]|nr:ADP-glyceromanno-heptose 6-epimerase [Lentisphaeria bacterium]